MWQWRMAYVMYRVVLAWMVALITAIYLYFFQEIGVIMAAFALLGVVLAALLIWSHDYLVDHPKPPTDPRKAKGE